MDGVETGGPGRSEQERGDVSSDRKEQDGSGLDGSAPEGSPGPRPPSSPRPSASPGLDAFVSSWTEDRLKGGDGPRGGRESRPVPGAAWNGPDYLFTGAPEALERERGRGGSDRAPRRPGPDPLSDGPGFLLTGVPETEGRRRREATAGAVRSAPDGPLIDPGLLVAPEPPRPSLRQRLVWLWQALRERFEHTSHRDSFT